jgi:hypothetical protein
MQIEGQEQRIYKRKYDSQDSILSTFADIKHKAIN